MAKILIVIYSTYTHIYQLALEVKKGVESADPKVEVELFQVPETLTPEILAKMHAPPKPDIPIITSSKLEEADGFLFGFPTRFGSMPAQFKAFLDSTGQLWYKGALNKKFAGIFFSTATQHGGQETTALTAVTYLAHHGINYVPLSTGLPYFGETSELIGGGPWGAGTITGSDASRPISEKEKEVARHQGKSFAEIVGAYVRGTKVISNEKRSTINDDIDINTNNDDVNGTSRDVINTNTNNNNNVVSEPSTIPRSIEIEKKNVKKDKRKIKSWLCCKSDTFLED